jgi:peptide/nickel transport system permease protein
MPAYLLRRIAMTIPTLLLVSIAVFVLMRLIPGDPVLLMLGEGADPAQLADHARPDGPGPAPARAVRLVWLRHALTGDLGQSTTNGLPVLPLIWERFHVSATIVLVAVALASLIAVPAGLLPPGARTSRPTWPSSGRHAHAVGAQLLARPAAADVLRPVPGLAAGGGLRAAVGELLAGRAAT